jgi:PHD/YefM family antitoxin component YafN of YafNO toxin-antitoxin module
MQAMTLNEAAQDLWSVIDTVNDNNEPLIVTDEHHKPIVIMSLDL